MLKLLRVASLALAVQACGSSETIALADAVPIEQLPPLDKDAITAAQPTGRIANTDIAFEASLWFDRMPGSNAQGLFSRGIVSSTTNGATVPANLAMTRMLVVRGNEAWSTESLSIEPSPTAPGVLERLARHGPEWPATQRVDVIVRVEDGSGAFVYLAARDNSIIEAL